MATVEDAIGLAARGFRVFPLRENDWRPKITGWVDAATTSEETIRRWWAQWPAANVGVATGQGLLVIDIDNKKGKRGSESFAALGLPPEALDTFTVETPSGGRHVYFECDLPVPNSVDRLGSGIDERGVGGYVVGPGSTLSEGAKDGQPGGTYQAVNTNRCQSEPGVLAGLRGGQTERNRSGHISSPSVLADDAHKSAGHTYAEQAKPAVEGAGGDQTTFVVAARLRDYGLSEEEAFDALIDSGWNDRCEPPWELGDLRTKVANAYAYAENPFGSKSPEVQFNGVHVPAIEKPLRAPSKWMDHGTPIARNALWLLPDVLPATGVAVLVAPSQAGKTFFLIEAARCVATGKPFFKIVPDARGATLFVYAGTEGSGLTRRFAALGEDTALPLSGMQVGNLAERNALAGLLEDLKAKAAEMLMFFGLPVRLIVIETIAASGLLNDENSNAEASRAIANLGQISLAMNALVVTSHHPPKAGKGGRGAGAITDNADYVIEIHRNGRDKVRQVELTKGRDAEQRTLGSFSLLPVSLGKDDHGRDITSMTISMGEPETPAARMTKHAPLLMEVIEWAGIEAGRTIEGKMCVPKDQVWAVFQDRCKTPTDRSNQHKVYRQALEYLESQGVIEYVDHGRETFIHRRELFT